MKEDTIGKKSTVHGSNRQITSVNAKQSDNSGANDAFKNKSMKNDNSNCNLDNKMKKRVRNVFTPEDDKKLRELIQIYGDHSWILVSSLMENRNPRQCRERWKHYLSCDYKDSAKPWTKYEDEVIILKYGELGPKWTKIAKELHGRSDLQVKMRYMKHLKNKNNEDDTESEQSTNINEFFPENKTEKVEIIQNNNNSFTNIKPTKDQESEKQDQTKQSNENELRNENDTQFDFNDDFDFMPSNIIMQSFDCNENNFIYQGFESDLSNWLFE